MSKAFISYSLNTTEDYIVSNLSQLLKQHGFSVQSSYNYNPRSTILDFTGYTAMQKSDLFVGVITAQGRWERVWHEYQVAKSLNVPALLLAEDVFQQITPEQNVVRFSRNNPADAIRQVEAIMKPAQNDSPNIVAWIAGGSALLGLLHLLSNDDGKQSQKPTSSSKPKGNCTPITKDEVRTILMKHQEKGFHVDSRVMEGINNFEEIFSLIFETQDEYLDYIMWPSMDSVRPLTPETKPRTLRDCANRLVKYDWSFEKIVKDCLLWFTECICIDCKFSFENFGCIILTELNKTEREETPMAKYAIYDGTHRSIVLAKKLICKEIEFQPIKAFLFIPKRL